LKFVHKAGSLCLEEGFGVKALLIEGAAVIDGTGSAPVTPGAVLVRGDVIEAVGSEALNLAGEGVEKLDCGKQTLLPGLIDCHNHLSLDPTLDNYLHRMTDPLPELTIRAVRSMEIDLRSGVTTSRYLGDKEFLDVHCRQAQAEGRLTGPRIITATRGLRSAHGHGFVGYPFGGVENIRQAVRENLSAGADLIKVYLTGTLKSPRGLPEFYSREEVQTLVDEAHRAGVPVATHCIGGPALRTAVETGIDVIEHGYFITDEEIELLLKSGRWLVMTPSIFFTDERIRTLPANLVDGHFQQREEVQRRLTAAVKAGVKYAAGTDAMHGGLGKELQYLVDFGASPLDALLAATSRAADVCGLADKIGIIAPGYQADILGVDGNPIEDIRAVQHVLTVVQGGNVIHHSTDRT
jgi:imidazolonepropionase-like amidohydrolase